MQSSSSWNARSPPHLQTPIPIKQSRRATIASTESLADDSDASASIFDADDPPSDAYSDTDISASSVGELGLPPGIDPDERLLNPKAYFRGLQTLETAVVANSGLFLLSQKNRQAYPNGKDFNLRFSFDSHTPHGIAVGAKSFDDEIMSFCRERGKSGAGNNSASTWEPEYLAFHVLECRNLMLAVVSNVERLRKAHYCTDSINVLALDPRRPRVANLVRIDVDRIIQLHQNFEHALEKMLTLIRQPKADKLELQQLTEPLSSACTLILDSLGLPPGHNVAGKWRKAAIVLDLAVISYAGAHVERFDHRFLGEDLDLAKITSSWSFDTLCREGIMLRRRSLRCLQPFLRGRQVWLLQSQSQWDDDGEMYLSTTMEEFADIWGPVWAAKSSNESEEILHYNAGMGAVVPWPEEKLSPELVEGEVFAHWRSPDEVGRKAPTSLRPGARLLIGGIPSTVESR